MTDEHYLYRCLELARLGGRKVFPNPLVGAVLVHEGQIIGEGYHAYAGGPHAEVKAIAAVSDPACLSEATLYVSLEPCCIQGKTPPCTSLILEKRIPRVVIGTLDPNPRVSGRGVAQLRTAGVEVKVAGDPGPFQHQNRRFFVNQQLGHPYVTLKFAQSADGFLAGFDAEGNPCPTPITQKVANRFSHRLRAAHHAILIGRNTASIDDPLLTNRYYYGGNPIRMILDRKLSLRPDLRLFKDDSAPTWVLNEERDGQDGHVRYFQFSPWPELPQLLRRLYQAGIVSILVEGGAQTLSKFMDWELYDEVFLWEGSSRLGQGLPAPAFSTMPMELVEGFGPDRLFHALSPRGGGF